MSACRRKVNDNAMTTEKDAEGIRKFTVDMVKLEKLVASKIGVSKLSWADQR